MAKRVCIDCAQEVVELPKDTTIELTLRKQTISTSSAFCEGCFQTIAVKYMCPFGHLMCEECGNADMGDDWKPSEAVKDLAATYQNTIKDMMDKNELKK